MTTPTTRTQSSSPSGPDVRSRSVAIPALLHVGNGCLGRIAPMLADHAFDLGHVCVCSGPGPSNAPADEVVDGLRAAGVHVSRLRDLDGALDQAADTAAHVIAESVTLVVGVGGGRVIDTAKLAAARTSVDFISVPTAISHDGISSPVASLRQKDGTRESYAAAMPAGIVVDVAVSCSAPERAVRAGVGDLASNLTAILDWRLADRRGRDRFDAFSAMIAESAARPVVDLEDLGTAESHEILAKGLLLSGLAMAAAGTSRPCSGAEHLISHSLDHLLGADAAMHGEQVALGALVSAAAHDPRLHATLREVFTRLGLPVRPADLGLSDDLVREAVLAAPATRPDRYTILSECLDGDAAAGHLLERAFA
jgi:glycerol-1-phosphate dehydrogenase [NAD(P)+]